MQSNHDRIDDNGIYTGREVKRLLAAVQGEPATAVRWLELEEASKLLEVKPDTLRKRCARWALMKHPTVRVRKKGPASGSHWLLDENDVFAQRRRRVVSAEPSATPETEDEEALLSYWERVATENL